MKREREGGREGGREGMKRGREGGDEEREGMKRGREGGRGWKERGKGEEEVSVLTQCSINPVIPTCPIPRE